MARSCSELAIVLSVTLAASVASNASAATVQLCSADCICISWPRSNGEYLEVRCPGGDGDWVTEEPQPGDEPPDGD